MLRISLVSLCLLSPIACAPGPAEDGARDPDDPSAEAGAGETLTPDAAEQVAGTVKEFHRALSSADSTAALALLHPDAIIYESGHAETVEEYRSGHLPADIRFAAATEREVVSERSVELGSSVLYLAETRVRGTMGEREVDSRGVETMVLARERDRWIIRHIHWSNR